MWIGIQVHQLFFVRLCVCQLPWDILSCWTKSYTFTCYYLTVVWMCNGNITVYSLILQIVTFTFTVLIISIHICKLHVCYCHESIIVSLCSNPQCVALTIAYTIIHTYRCVLQIWILMPIARVSWFRWNVSRRKNASLNAHIRWLNISLGRCRFFLLVIINLLYPSLICQEKSWKLKNKFLLSLKKVHWNSERFFPRFFGCI